jgi:hypothetical protein
MIILTNFKMIADNKGVLAFNLIHWFKKVEYLSEMMDELMKIDLHKPKVNSFDFNEGREAFEFLQSGKSIGKVVLVIKN